MKKITRCISAVFIFIILIIIGNWPGSGIKDEWDNLMKWVKDGKRR